MDAGALDVGPRLRAPRRPGWRRSRARLARVAAQITLARRPKCAAVAPGQAAAMKVWGRGGSFTPRRECAVRAEEVCVLLAAVIISFLEGLLEGGRATR